MTGFAAARHPAPSAPGRVAHSGRALRRGEAFQTLPNSGNVMKARVTVTLKNGVLDPQGKAIQGALGALGFSGVDSVRQGRVIDLELADSDPASARAKIAEMCEALLANTVIESYAIDIAG